MVISNPSLKSLVIQEYLNGKSRDQIVKEVGISTGKVSNTIKDWKLRIGIPNVEELFPIYLEFNFFNTLF